MQESDYTWLLVAFTTGDAHKAATGPKKQGRSRVFRPEWGGFLTKAHAVVDTLGNCLKLTLGQQANCTVLPDPLAALPQPPGAVEGDKAYDRMPCWRPAADASRGSAEMKVKISFHALESELKLHGVSANLK